MPVATARLALGLLVFLLAAGLAEGQSAPEVQTEPLGADGIMARVADNQDRGEALRKEYVYKQHIHIVTHKPGSRMMREETADYDVVPLPDGTQKQLKSLIGRYWSKGKYVEFQGESVVSSTDEDLIQYLRNHDSALGSVKADADLIHYLHNYLLNDDSKDGLARSLFPLTSEEQKGYDFKLLGQESEAGRNVYHIAFTPKEKDKDKDKDEEKDDKDNDKDKEAPTWAGEAFIDATEFQPVRLFTKMSRRIPFLVRTTWFDLPGFGFNVSYKRQGDGVWFPSAFGTEFQMHVGPMFFFNRDVSISLENSGFEHTPVETK